MEEKINLDRTLKIKIIRVLSSDLFIFFLSLTVF